MKQWHFYDKVYRRWVVLMIGSLEDLKTDLESYGYTDMEEIRHGKGMCIKLDETNNTADQRCFIVWMPEYETATLVHELSHLVIFVFDQLDIPLSLDNTEGYAFYLEYWWNEITRVRKRYPNGRPPKLAKT
jgi:hypothetical protein